MEPDSGFGHLGRRLNRDGDFGPAYWLAQSPMLQWPRTSSERGRVTGAGNPKTIARTTYIDMGYSCWVLSLGARSSNVSVYVISNAVLTTEKHVNGCKTDRTAVSCLSICAIVNPG